MAVEKRQVLGGSAQPLQYRRMLKPRRFQDVWVVKLDVTADGRFKGAIVCRKWKPRRAGTFFGVHRFAGGCELLPKNELDPGV